MPPIDDVFKKLRGEGRKALMPFLTAGDPDLQTTAAVIAELAERGASLCELGIPYSDPVADGPVIQASYTRALAGDLKLADVMAMLSYVTPKVEMPVVTMVSYAIVYRHGLRDYVEMAKDCGVAGAIVPDLPVDEAAPMAEICREYSFSLIQLVTPTTPDDRALRIAETSSGFIYYVSVAGITGERKELPPELIDRVGWLRERTPLPICIGFRHQRAVARPAARAGGRRADRRLGDRAPRRGARPAWAEGLLRCGGRVRRVSAGGAVTSSRGAVSAWVAFPVSLDAI